MPSSAFELRPSPGKGWGAFATRRIERGAMILREKPLWIIRKPHEEITDEDIWAAFQQLGPNEKQKFLCLRENASRPFTDMYEAFAENSFSISDSPTTGSPMHGLFILHSRFNHSCIPNCKLPTTNEEVIASFATRDIVVDEEITFCYNIDFESRTTHERHEALRFVCDCKACLVDTPFHQLSDIRRRFIRGLQYLTRGVDLKVEEQTSASSIIVDSKLRKSAEEFSIPLSARLIYDLLGMYLLEEEGLLDDFMVKRMNPGIRRTTTWFGTESNAVIARLAIAQESWLRKLCVAFRLWGREDAADHTMAVALRRLRDSRHPPT